MITLLAQVRPFEAWLCNAIILVFSTGWFTIKQSCIWWIFDSARSRILGTPFVQYSWHIERRRNHYFLCYQSLRTLPFTLEFVFRIVSTPKQSDRARKLARGWCDCRWEGLHKGSQLFLSSPNEMSSHYPSVLPSTVVLSLKLRDLF